MKSINLNILYKIAATIVLLITISSCSDLFNNPMNDKESGNKINLLLIDPNVFDTWFNIHFITPDGEYADNKEIKIYFSGEDASTIVDFDGKKKDSYITDNGKLMLAIDPNIEVSESNPLNITLYIDINDNSYDAFPVEIEYTSNGAYDIVVDLVAPDELKSTFIKPGWEPFDINFNNVLIKSINDPVWSYIRNLSYLNGKTYYSIYKAYTPPAGKLVATNLSTDINLLSNWGIEGVYLIKNNVVSTFNLTHNEVLVNNEISLFKTYSAIQRNNMKKCSKGINIEVKGKDGLSGSAKFDYTIWANNEKIHSGRIGSKNIPFKTNTGTFYYPENTSSVIVKLNGDGQYNIEPSEVTLSNFCGSTAHFVAIPKTGLIPYKLITNISCDDNPIGISPSMSGRYKIKGSNDPWTYFNFESGICTLQLKPGETYYIESSINDIVAEFDLPTDESKIPEIVQQLLNDNEDINDIQYHIETTSIGKEIKIHVYFKKGKCPF